MLKGFSFLFFLYISLCSFGVSLAGDPMNPTNFSHKIRKEAYKCNPNLKIKISLARVHDNKLVNTPFGQEVGGTKIEDLRSSTPKIVETRVRYDTREDEYGYNRRIRELLIYQISSVRCLQLVEREEINAIIREWDFSDTKYVKKGREMPAIEMPSYIAKAFVTLNDGSCKKGENESEAWGAEDDGLPKDRILILLRLYDIHSAYIKIFACGTGNNVVDAIREAVKNLEKHRDLLLPTVRVTSVTGNRVELDGGSEQGLSIGTKFYLVRVDGPKESIGDFDALDYVALCTVTGSNLSSASAVIKKNLRNGAPQEGDIVFYHFPEESF